MKANGQLHNELQLTKVLVDLMKKNQTLMIDDKPAAIFVVIVANDKCEFIFSEHQRKKTLFKTFKNNFIYLFR